MSPEEERDLDRMLYDIMGKKLMLAKQALGGDDTVDAVHLILEALDNLYALLSHALLGEETALNTRLPSVEILPPTVIPGGQAVGQP